MELAFRDADGVHMQVNLSMFEGVKGVEHVPPEEESGVTMQAFDDVSGRELECELVEHRKGDELAKLRRKPLQLDPPATRLVEVTQLSRVVD